MISKGSRKTVHEEKHWRMRSHPSDTTQRPRLSIFRNNSHTHAQIIGDTVDHALVAASTLKKEAKSVLERTGTVGAAAYVDKLTAEYAKEQGISAVVFDGGGFLHTGKIQAFADATREADL